ncbi:MAG TPA: hypothetical protein VJ939_02120 [Bacteroidales bacterium]|nr:hypothetical protein [Bacteroidales bacterium]
MKKLLILFVSLVTLSSCLKDKSKVAPENIFLELNAQYVAAAEETYVRAVFHKDKINGQIVELDGDGQILVNGQKMVITNPLIGGYNHVFDGYVDSLMVSYSDRDGNVYDNYVDMELAPYISVPSSLDSINIQQDYNLVWNGPAITLENERVILEYGDSGSNSYSAITDEVDGTSILIPSRDLMSFGEGEINMFLTRSVDLDLENAPPKGGTLSIDYSSGREKVELIYE